MQRASPLRILPPACFHPLMTTPARTTPKADLRARFRAYRTALPAADAAARSAAIVDRVRALPALARARTVHCYWPLVERGEVDTRPLIRALHAGGVTVVLPVVEGFADDAPALSHHRYAGPEALQTNRWGLREPVGTEAVPLDALDVVIVPAFGAGRNGHRIGHGYGYYDAFLAQIDAPTIALVYDACLVAALPAAPHDVPVSILVTESETIHVPPGT